MASAPLPNKAEAWRERLVARRLPLRPIDHSTRSIACAARGAAGSSRRSARVRTRGCDLPLAAPFQVHGAGHLSQT